MPRAKKKGAAAAKEGAEVLVTQASRYAELLEQRSTIEEEIKRLRAEISGSAKILGVKKSIEDGEISKEAAAFECGEIVVTFAQRFVPKGTAFEDVIREKNLFEAATTQPPREWDRKKCEALLIADSDLRETWREALTTDIRLNRKRGKSGGTDD